MTDTTAQPTPPPSPMPQTTRRSRLRRIGRPLFLAAALLAAFYAGGVSLQHLQAQGMHGFMAHQTDDGQFDGPPGPMMQRRFGPPPMFGMAMMNPGQGLEVARYRLDRALSQLDATPEQKIKVLAVFDENAKAFTLLPIKAFATRHDLVSLLTAPTIDRGKLEALRTERLADADAASKVLVKAIADAADVLSPEQRIRVAMFVERFHR